MNSRTILISGAFCLACVILLGSTAIQLVVGGERPQDPPTEAAPKRTVVAERQEPPNASEPAPPRRPPELIKLQALARQAEALMASDPSFSVSSGGSAAVPLSEEAVTLFAEMVKIIDESPGLRFVMEVGDPDEFVASERAELLRSSLLLSLQYPSRLRLEEKTTASAQLTVRTIDPSVSP